MKNKSKKRILIIEPHSDDSAIAAGGYLEHCSKNCELFFILVSASSMQLRHKFVSKEERIEEYQRYVSSLGGLLLKPKSQNNNLYLPSDMDSKLDQVARADLVNAIEESIFEIKPDELLVMGPSFHHDHTIVYESVKAATRPTFSYSPSSILIMENPTYIHSWNSNFTPNSYFVMSEKILNLKLERFKNFFPSQLRSSGNYLSVEGLSKWAKYRGIEARSNYAEAFHTVYRLLN